MRIYPRLLVCAPLLLPAAAAACGGHYGNPEKVGVVFAVLAAVVLLPIGLSMLAAVAATWRLPFVTRVLRIAAAFLLSALMEAVLAGVLGPNGWGLTLVFAPLLCFYATRPRVLPDTGDRDATGFSPTP